MDEVVRVLLFDVGEQSGESLFRVGLWELRVVVRVVVGGEEEVVDDVRRCAAHDRAVLCGLQLQDPEDAVEDVAESFWRDAPAVGLDTDAQ